MQMTKRVCRRQKLGNTVRLCSRRHWDVQKQVSAAYCDLSAWSAMVHSHSKPRWLFEWRLPRNEYCSVAGNSCTPVTEHYWRLRTALFWAVTQCVVVTPYRRFGTTYRSLLFGGSLNSCTVLNTAFTVRIYSIVHQSSTSDRASITLTGKYSWIYNHPSRFWRWAFSHLFSVAN